MSLTPTLTVEVTADNVVLKDETTYGVGSDPDRVDCTVNFSGVTIDGDDETAATMPSYDEDVVSQVTLSSLPDGRARFTLTIVDDEGTEYTDTKEVFIYSDLLSCYNEKRNTYFDACCDGDVSDKLISVISTMKLAIDTIEDMVALEYTKNAACIYNGIILECQEDDCIEC